MDHPGTKEHFRTNKRETQFRICKQDKDMYTICDTFRAAYMYYLNSRTEAAKTMCVLPARAMYVLPARAMYVLPASY